jgi:holo-[acyl-carrier protein] synthase
VGVNGTSLPLRVITARAAIPHFLPFSAKLCHHIGNLSDVLFFCLSTKNSKLETAFMIYGIGVDLVKVARLAAAIERFGERFLNRVFTPQEIAYCQGKRRSDSAFALRFAAKEAFSKALGVGLRRDGIRCREVEVVPNPMGKPELAVSGRAAELCQEAGITAMHLSLTDEDSQALAVVILER